MAKSEDLGADGPLIIHSTVEYLAGFVQVTLLLGACPRVS